MGTTKTCQRLAIICVTLLCTTTVLGGNAEARRRLLSEREKITSELKDLDKKLTEFAKREENLLDAIELGVDKRRVNDRASRLAKIKRSISAKRDALARRKAEIDSALKQPEMMTSEQRIRALEKRLSALDLDQLERKLQQVSAKLGAMTSAADGKRLDVIEGKLVSINKDKRRLRELESELRQLKSASHTGTVVAPATASNNRLLPGLELAIGLGSVLQASKGAEGLSPKGDVTDATLAFSLEGQIPVGKNGTAFLLVEAGNGAGLDGHISTLSGLNDDADDDENLRMSEAWYEHMWADGRYRFRLGKISLTSDFDTNEVDVFLSSGFLNNLAIEFPDNGYGLMAWACLGESLEVGLGLQDSDSDWENLDKDLFSILQFNLKAKFGKHEGNYRFHGWLHRGDHTDITEPSRTDQRGYGAGVSFDQQLPGDLIVFGRYGFQNKSVYDLGEAWHVGLKRNGLSLASDDFLALAYGRAVLSADYGDSSGTNDGDEHHVELTYGFQVGERISLQLDAQWLGNPNGDRDNDDIWLFGVRMGIDF